jgi:ADP-ribose pyrophosphatase YjhB (NUDIX family)
MTKWYAHVTVATVIEKDGRFLLVEEMGEDGLVFNQPAGHLDPGEDLVSAAIRETLEETGWHVEVEGLVGMALYTAPANGVTYHRTTFYARALEHDPEIELDTGIERALWMNPDEMVQQADRMRSPLVIAAMEQYLRGQRYPLDFIYGQPT